MRQQVQDELVLGGEAPYCSQRERGASSLQRNAVLRQPSCHSVIEPIESNRLLDAIRCYRISRYCRPRTIDHGSTIFWGGQDKARLGRRDLTTSR